jgi:trk system potassium uptake protein TrkA
VLFNVPNRIARIRAIEYLENDKLSDGTLFDISHVICPEQVLTDYLLKLVAFPEALQVVEFAHGRVMLVAIRAREDGLLVGYPISDLLFHLPSWIRSSRRFFGAQYGSSWWTNNRTYK